MFLLQQHRKKWGAAAALLVVLTTDLWAQPSLPEVGFAETWGYLKDGEESLWNLNQPLTDIGYFGAGIDSRGALYGVPNPGKLVGYKGRVHLVVAEVSSRMATHFVMNKDWPLRKFFLDDIAAAAKPFDGVQLDFETLRPDDKETFYGFVADLRARLPGKIFSLAIPARLSDNEFWDYARLDKLADRLIIMAYDEHWAGSDPGPVASLAFCDNVARYALTRIAPERLVMGLPFYGRAWADRSLSRAYRYTGVDRIFGSETLDVVRRDKGIPYFEYTTRVKVKVFFDDVYSLTARLSNYREQGVRAVAFWRLGQEDPRFWKQLLID